MTPPATAPPRFMLARRLWPWLCAVVSGLLLTLSFPPFDQGGIVWFALVPLLAATWFREPPEPRRPWLRRLRGLGPGYLAGLVFFASTFHWLGSLADLYRDQLLLSLPLLVAAIFGFYTGLWTWFLEFIVPRGDSRRFANSWRNLATGAAGASAWVLLEWIRSWLFGGFGWNGLGIALHRDLAMIQLADLTGTWGLSWLVAFVNLMIVIVVRRLVGELGPAFMKRVRWEFSISVAIVVAVFAYGVRALLRDQLGATQPLRVAAIQPNIPQVEKFDPQFETKTLATLGQLSSLAMVVQPPPQLLVWPEACTPRSIFGDEETLKFVIGHARHPELGLLLGTLDFDPERAEDYNVAALLTHAGEEQQVYRKIHLVPFGEYLPLRPLFQPFVGALVPGDFTRGTEFKLLHLREPAVALAALVCFEDTLGDLTRRFVAAGAQLLVNVTNDGWFADSPAAEQHLANSIFRAIETRRPLLRCGNTGLTGSIDPYGRLARHDRGARDPMPKDVVQFLRPFEQGFVSGQISVPLAGRITFYTRHGDWLPRLCLGLSLLAVLRAGLARRRVQAS